MFQPASTSTGKTVKKSFLKDVMASRRKQMEEGVLGATGSSAPDPYEICYKYIGACRKETAIGTSVEVMCAHKNTWDANNPECPGRLEEIINRMAALSLLTRCKILPDDDNCSAEDVELIHSSEHLPTLKNISQNKNPDEQEEAAANYDGIYFCQDTFEAAMKSLTWTLRVVKEVCQGKCHNGFAIVRPPGHHAKHNAYAGYCYFNNVAIAAQKCLKEEKTCKKIMIVDFDVHHGDGTQEVFYDRKDVLYFSIHRYEHGLFWPNLREGNFDYIGDRAARGYNINVPLNVIGLRDTDYLAIVFNLLLPIAYEFRPSLILISAGFDAAAGCPEGQMLVSPGCFSHIVQLLAGVAEGRIAMVLEGGYFIPSLSESAAMSLKGLLGDPCPPLAETALVQRSVVDTINDCKGVLYDYWNCFTVVQRFAYCIEREINQHEEHVPTVKYFGQVEQPPYMTRDCYPVLCDLAVHDFNSFVARFRNNEGNFREFKGTGYCFEDCVLLHVPNARSHSFENPARLVKIMELMEESNLTKTCIEIKMPRNRDVYEYCIATHDKLHVDTLLAGELQQLHDLYINEYTAKAALTSVGVLLSVVDAVLSEEVTNGVALIRPPGHHAGINKAQGFCFLNNVAIAADYARKTYNAVKIMIVDFDVHHGNGTQEIFYHSRDVLYISIHRYDYGNYYPFKISGGAKFVGHGPGEGFNVNIPFNVDTMGNSEYLAAFLNIILPIGYSFNPDLVLVSAGFDAGVHDPLGGYHVTPEMFGQFIYLLKPLAMGKMVIALEGGYNVHTTAYGMLMCVKALRGESVPIPPDVFKRPVNKHAAQTIRDVIAIHQQYWPSLNVMKSISDKTLLYRYEKNFSEDIYTISKFDSSYDDDF